MALKPTAYPGVVISYGEQDLMWLANVSEDIRMLESNSHAKSLLKSFDGLTPKVTHAHSDAVVIIERPATNEFNMPGFSKMRVDRQSGVVYQSLPEKKEHSEWRKGNSRLLIAHDTKICCSAVNDDAAQDPERGSASFVRFSNHEMLMSSGAWMRSYVGLAHELIHALHNARGEQLHPYLNEEHRTVGINGFEDEEMTENSIRRRFGLPRRTAY